MNRGVTTSVRLPPKLRDQLETAAHLIHKGKNYIVVCALEEYLTKFNQAKLTEEARRQSLLAKQAEKKGDKAWSNETDVTGWE
jgi:predicted DNA-binding protein